MRENECLHCRLMEVAEKWFAANGEKLPNGSPIIDGETIIDALSKCILEIVHRAEDGQRDDVTNFVCSSLRRLSDQIEKMPSPAATTPSRSRLH